MMLDAGQGNGSELAMRVADFLRFIAKLKGISRNDADTRIRAWLERVELPGVSQKRCEELSKGMQQKLQFIASVLHEPPLLILDEPFSGLDPVNRRLLSSVVRQLKESGTTILFSTHQMEQAEDLCDQVLLIHKGEKVLDETMKLSKPTAMKTEVQFLPKIMVPKKSNLTVDRVSSSKLKAMQSTQKELDNLNIILQKEKLVHSQSAGDFLKTNGGQKNGKS